MFTEECFSIVKSEIKFFLLTCHCPYEWRKVRGHTYLTYNSSKSLLPWFLMNICIWIHPIYLLYRLATIPFQTEKLDPAVVLQYFMWLWIHSVLPIFPLHFIFKNKEICMLMNCTLSLWRRHRFSKLDEEKVKNG